MGAGPSSSGSQCPECPVCPECPACPACPTFLVGNVRDEKVLISIATPLVKVMWRGKQAADLSLFDVIKAVGLRMLSPIPPIGVPDLDVKGIVAAINALPADMTVGTLLMFVPFKFSSNVKMNHGVTLPLAGAAAILDIRKQLSQLSVFQAHNPKGISKPMTTAGVIAPTGAGINNVHTLAPPAHHASAPVHHASAPTAVSCTKLQGLLTNIDVAANGSRMAGVNSVGHPFTRTNGGWQYIPGTLIQVSINSHGSIIWGVNSAGDVYHTTDFKTWPGVPGAKLKSVTVSGTGGVVYGINKNAPNNLVMRANNKWTQLDGGNLRQVSTNDDGSIIWGTDNNSNVWYKAGPHGTWQTDSGAKFKWIDVSNDGKAVVGVGTDGAVYQRQGTSWSKLSVKLSQVSLNQTGSIMCGVNAASDIWQCKITPKLALPPTPHHTALPAHTVSHAPPPPKARLIPSGVGKDLGCYWDGGHASQPSFRAVPTITPGNVGSPQECADRARKAGKSVYALQDGGQCFVGGDMARATKFGKASGACAALGGPWINRVYDLSA